MPLITRTDLYQSTNVHDTLYVVVEAIRVMEDAGWSVRAIHWQTNGAIVVYEREK